MRVAALAAIALVGCAVSEPVSFRVFVPPGETPLEGADAIVVSILEDGVPVRSQQPISFAVDARSFDLGEIPFGTDLAIAIEARRGSLVLARGRSFPFDYPSADAPPREPPDVTMLRIGRSAMPLRDVALGERASAVVGVPEGALIALESGRVVLFDAHAGERGEPELAEHASLTPRAGARWVALAGTLLGVGGAEPGATALRADGTRADGAGSLGTPSLLLALSDGRALAVADDGSVHVLSVLGSDIAESTLAPLDHAPGTPLSGTGVETRAGPRGLIVEPARIVLVDPDGRDPRTELALATEIRGRAAGALETGLVVLAGGNDVATGEPSVEIAIVLVRPQTGAVLETLRDPPPQSLFVGRSGSALVPYGSGLALVAGGTGLEGALSDVEIVDVRLDRLPGEVALTGALPVPLAEAVGTPLEDGSVLFVGAEGLVLHAPAR